MQKPTWPHFPLYFWADPFVKSNGYEGSLYDWEFGSNFQDILIRSNLMGKTPFPDFPQQKLIFGQPYRMGHGAAEEGFFLPSCAFFLCDEEGGFARRFFMENEWL